MSKWEVVRWKVDGRTIEGALTTPTESVDRPPCALVVDPHSRTGRGSSFNAQIPAASGYAVLAPDFRGSSGYGQAFIDADRGDFVRDHVA